MVTFTLNGTSVTAEADGDTPLLYMLANDFRQFGPKYGCGAAECGSCMVLIGDSALPSCVITLSSVENEDVTTLAGLTEEGGMPGRLQRAFLAEQAAQCGYCLSGIIISAEALLRENPNPTETEVREGLDRNLCRCGAHNSMVRAVLRAAGEV